MKIRLTAIVWSLSCLAFIGCTGKGDVLPIDIPSKQVSGGTLGPQSEELRVAVEPLEDSRPQNGRLGVRSHLWGGKVTSASHVVRPARLPPKRWHSSLAGKVGARRSSSPAPASIVRMSRFRGMCWHSPWMPRAESDQPRSRLPAESSSTPIIIETVVSSGWPSMGLDQTAYSGSNRRMYSSLSMMCSTTIASN